MFTVMHHDECSWATHPEWTGPSAPTKFDVSLIKAALFEFAGHVRPALSQLGVVEDLRSESTSRPSLSVSALE